MAKSILVADDSPSMLAMIVFTLKGAGYSVTEAVDGVDAVEKARKVAFDMVLTDQNMPRLDGLGVVTALRGLPQYQKTPILILTTEQSDDMKQRGRASGATGWLVKPFDPMKMTQVVAKLFS